MRRGTDVPYAEDREEGRTAAGGPFHRPDLSVVVPLYDEEDSVDEMASELLATLDGMPESSEVILIDDGSSDRTAERAFRWHQRDPRVRVLQFRRNFGQTAAITAGFRHATGRVVVLMDGDQQNDPRDIPLLLEGIAEGYDVVSGWRKDRKDTFIRRFPSRMANRLISRTTGTHLHDYGCTLKAYNGDVLRQLNLYGEQHRFIPALASQIGARVTEVAVNHRPRTRGKSKYGIGRTFRVLLDLFTLKFLLKYLARPMHFFGVLGLLSFALGLTTLLYLVIDKLVESRAIGDRPLTILGVLLTILGVQFISMGLLGELLIRIYHEVGRRTAYVLRRTSDRDDADRALSEFNSHGRPELAGDGRIDELDRPLPGGAWSRAAGQRGGAT